MSKLWDHFVSKQRNIIFQYINLQCRKMIALHMFEWKYSSGAAHTVSCLGSTILDLEQPMQSAVLRLQYWSSPCSQLSWHYSFRAAHAASCLEITVLEQLMQSAVLRLQFPSSPCSQLFRDYSSGAAYAVSCLEITVLEQPVQSAVLEI